MSNFLSPPKNKLKPTATRDTTDLQKDNYF